MQKDNKFQKIWEKLKDYDEPAFRALQTHLRQFEGEYWTLIDFFDVDGGKSLYDLTVKSMRSEETRNIQMKKANGTYSFFWASGSVYS